MRGGLLRVVSWNVSGLYDPKTKLLLENFLKSLHQEVHILMLQEVKATGFKLTSALQSILPDYHQIIAQSGSGSGGTALLIHQDFQIKDSGSIHSGMLAWAKVEGELGSFHIASVYVPGTPRERADLWKLLNNNLPNGNWIIGGDFNFTELAEISTTQSSLLEGDELEEWQAFKCERGLIDAYTLL